VVGRLNPTYETIANPKTFLLPMRFIQIWNIEIRRASI
jgi:hypothetical protein